jgi:hypothetical protein
VFRLVVLPAQVFWLIGVERQVPTIVRREKQLLHASSARVWSFTYDLGTLTRG